MIRHFLMILIIPFVARAQVPESLLQDLDRFKTVSLTLKSEQEKLHALQAQLFSKKMAWTPSLSVGVGRLNNPTTSTITTSTDYWKADAALNLWSGGSDYHSYKSADLNVEAQELNQVATDLKVEFQAAELIFRTLHSSDVVRSTRELVRLRDESHRIVGEKYKQGKVPLQEVAKSEIDKSQQETRLRTLEAENLELESQWRALLKDGVKTSQWPFDGEFKLPGLSPSSSQANDWSPATLRLEKLANSARESYRSQASRHYASLDLTATYQEYPLQAISTRQWTTGLLLTVPLWSRYETQASVASAHSTWVSAQSDLELARQSEQAKRDVLQKRIDLYRKSLTDAKKNVERAKSLYGDMVKSFRYGRMSVNELLLEQNRLIESELSLSQSQLSFHKIVMESCSLVGQPLRQCLK